MQNKTNNTQKANIFFLALFTGKAAELYNGVKVAHGRFGPAILLPTIPGMDPKKSRICLDKFNPANVSDKGKVYNALLKLNGGSKKFSDPQTFVTLEKPADDETKIIIIADKRWDFTNTLAANTSIKCERGTGNPNGSVAPGTMILNDGDSIIFTFEGRKYTITNFDGFAHLVAEKPAPVKKEVKVKPVAVEVVADNRVKIESNLKVVGKIDLKPKKVERPVQVPVVVKAKKPAVKPTAKKPEKSFFKGKGRGDNGNHFVATSEVYENIPATTGLGSVAGAEKLSAMVAEMKKGTKKKKQGAAKATA